ncbi:hypothetical protein HYW60_02530 [Candidatus Kaiserbacteria bacterium]|nr:hypothetical protein [Candidatus Kaiserbacteria bacterium]
MVIQKAVDNLKDKPKDEKKAIAGGIAIAVVLILLIGWTLLFFKKIQRGEQLQQLGGGAQDEFNFSNVRDAQEKLMESFNDVDALLEARKESSSQYQPLPTYDDVSGEPPPFGGYETTE